MSKKTHNTEFDDLDGYTKIDQYNPKQTDSIALHYKGILKALGENTEREGILNCLILSILL